MKKSELIKIVKDLGNDYLRHNRELADSDERLQNLENQIVELKDETAKKYDALLASIGALEKTCKCKNKDFDKDTQKMINDLNELQNKRTVPSMYGVKIELNKPDYFNQAKKLLIDYANKTLVKKGVEYTPTGDRFGNFRPILNQKKTALEKLLGYSEKHVQYMSMQVDNSSYPSDEYRRRGTAIGEIFGFGKERKNHIAIKDLEKLYKTYIASQPKIDEDGEPIEYDTAIVYISKALDSQQLIKRRIPYTEVSGLCENPEYYKQQYINELLEHFGDAFNYNILGMAMENTDIKNSVIGYADRQTQEKEINDIVKALESANSTSIRHKGYEGLMQCVSYWNLGFIMIELAEHLKRLDK